MKPCSRISPNTTARTAMNGLTYLYLPQTIITNAQSYIDLILYFPRVNDSSNTSTPHYRHPRQVGSPSCTEFENTQNAGRGTPKALKEYWRSTHTAKR